MTPLREEFALTAHNNAPIALVKRTPIQPPQGGVIVAPAMATPSRFYSDFSSWLAESGFVTYSFDYQGYGASALTPLRDVRADLFNWSKDVRTVQEWVSDDLGDLPLTWVGHSLGGQLLPFTNPSELRSAIIVASGTGYWGHAEGMHRLLAPALWFAIAPALTRLYGYYPGRRFKILGDLPAPAMRQWTTWCKHPDYLLGPSPEFREKFDAFSTPLTSLSFTDDETMSASATAHLLSLFSGTTVTDLRLTPESMGATRVGHMGFFQERNRTAWKGTLLPLLATRSSA